MAYITVDEAVAVFCEVMLEEIDVLAVTSIIDFAIFFLELNSEIVYVAVFVLSEAKMFVVESDIVLLDVFIVVLEAVVIGAVAVFSSFSRSL